MIAGRVWEAVESFNTRTSVGRVVVNPPEKRGEIKAHPTLEIWHFCKCGKAFNNPSSYALHSETHQNGNVTFQVGPPPTPIKSEKTVESASRKVLNKAPAKVIIRKPVQKETKIVVKQEPSPKKIHEVRLAPKGIKSIKGIRLHLKNVASVRPMWGTPTAQQLHANIHRCNQCEQIFILAAHLKAHVRLKHTPSLFSKVENAVQVEKEVPKSVPLISKPLAAKRLKRVRRITEARCEPCKFSFTSRIGYFHHLKVAHGGQGLHCCPHCPKKSLSGDALQIHINSFHKMTEPTSNVNTRSAGKRIQEECVTSADSVVDFPPPLADTLTNDDLKAVELPKDLTNYTSTRSGNHRKLPLVANKSSKAFLPRCKICRRVFYSVKLLQAHMIRKHNNLAVKPESRTVEKSVNLVHKDVSSSKLKSSPKKSSSILEAKLSGTASLEDKIVNGDSLFHDVVGTRTRSRLTSTNSSSISDPTLSDGSIMTLGSQALTDPTDNKEMEIAYPEAPPSEDLKSKSCGKIYETRRSSVRHTRANHPVENLLACKVCCLEFSTANRLKKHSLRHTLTSNLKTRESAKLSNDHPVSLPSALETKSNVHLNKRNDRSSSVRHLKRPFTSLNDELKDNEQNKILFNCSLCGKTFSHFFSLSQHLKNHSSPFSCDFCGTGFTVQKNLDLHNEKAHFPGGQYACDICPCVYENHRGLASHVAHRHQTKLQPKISVTSPGKNTIPLVFEGDISSTPIKTNERKPRLLPVIEGVPSPQKSAAAANKTETPDVVQKFTECEMCGCQIIKELYSSHLKEAHVVTGKFHCLQCTCVFESRQSLSIHKRAQHLYNVNKSLKKPISTKQNVSSESPKSKSKETSDTVLGQDKLSVNNSEWSSCTLCRLSIPGGSTALKKHLQIAHVNPSTFRCQHCSCSFRDQRSLVVHMTNVIHPTNDNQGTSILIAQSSIGTVQLVPHFRPVLPHGTSLTVFSTTNNLNEQFPWKNSGTSLEKKKSAKCLVEESVPKIISYYSQNPEYIKKQSPQKNNESDVVICEETDPLELNIGKLGEVIKNEAKKLKKVKDVHKVQINSEISLSIVSANENGEDNVLKFNGTSGKNHGKIEDGLQVTSREKSIRIKKKALLPPPPTELATVSSEYQLPFDPRPVKPLLNDGETFIFQAYNPSTIMRKIDLSTAEKFSDTGLEPIAPELTMVPLPTFDRASKATTDDCSSWTLSKLLGTINDDDDFHTPSENNSSKEAVASQKCIDVGLVADTDPLEILLVKSANTVEFKNSSQNKTRLATCSVCKKSFFSQQKLTRHMTLHEDQAKQALKPGGKCGYCGQNFDVHAALWAHLKECRGNKSVS